MHDLRNCNCMDLMREFPDKHFELAIVDPPYGINNTRAGGRGINGWRDYGDGLWDRSAPQPEYFSELFRVSQNQIIWGANHFISKIPYDFPGFVIWDKGQRDFSLADGELAWTSHKRAARIFTYTRAAALQEGKIHPTQKPVALYRWLLHNYAKPGDKILDTHLGSGSIAIACHEKGFHLTGSELDPDYFAAMQKRLAEATAQGDMFGA